MVHRFLSQRLKPGEYFSRRNELAQLIHAAGRENAECRSAVEVATFPTEGGYGIGGQRRVECEFLVEYPAADADCVAPSSNAVEDLKTSERATTLSSGLSATFFPWKGEKGLCEHFGKRRDCE